LKRSVDQTDKRRGPRSRWDEKTIPRRRVRFHWTRAESDVPTNEPFYNCPHESNANEGNWSARNERCEDIPRFLLWGWEFLQEN